MRQAALALAEAGQLDQFWTGVYWPTQSRFGGLVPARLRAELQRRSFPRPVEPSIRTYPWREAMRLGAQKLASGLPERVRFLSANASFESLSRRVGRELDRTSAPPRVIYAYDHCALDVFKAARKRDVRTVYDLTAPYWRYTRQINLSEAERFPEWRATLGSLDYPASTYARKDAEIALADRIVVASQFARRALLEYEPTLANRVSVIPYGAPPTAPRSRETRKSGPLRVIYAGRLTLAKGLPYLAEAARRLRGVIDLTIVGSRPARCAPLDELLASTRWIPSLPHDALLRLMQEQDVLLFPSLFEGYGLVVTEAMSQGLAVVTTDRTIGGDIIENWSNGVLVPPNSADAIVEALQRLDADRMLLAQIGTEAQRWCAGHGWATYRERLSETVDAAAKAGDAACRAGAI